MGFKKIDEAGWDELGNFMFQGWTDDVPSVYATYTFSQRDGWSAWQPYTHKIDSKEPPPEVLAAFTKDLN